MEVPSLETDSIAYRNTWRDLNILLLILPKFENQRKEAEIKVRDNDSDEEIESECYNQADGKKHVKEDIEKNRNQPFHPELSILALKNRSNRNEQ